MATTVKRKQWVIPPSYDVGVHFYYRNLLAGSEYVQAFVREYIAEFDKPYTKLFKALASGGVIDPAERPKMSYRGLQGVLEEAGVDAKTMGHITDHISHMAGGIGKPLDYFRIREFLAYCGIDGIYDLKAKTHTKAEKKVFRIPATVDPVQWRNSPDVDQIRTDIAFLMDNSGRVAEIEKEISLMDKAVWAEFVTEMTKDLKNNPPVGDIEPARKKYLEDRPHLVPMNAQLEELVLLKAQTIEDLKDRYAPLDPSFSLPTLGIEFDKDWYDKGEQSISAHKPYRQKFDKQMAALGKKKGDPEYDAFDWQQMRTRSFALFDWAIRDFTTNKVNRGVIAEARKTDIPRRFVQAVKAEIEDGLLERLNFPYRLEAVAGTPGSYAIICNECVAEAFTLESVLEIEKQLLAEDVANNAKKPKTQPKPVKPVEMPAQKPVQTARERQIATAERNKRLVDSLTIGGVLPDMTFDDGKGNRLTAAEALAAADIILADNANTQEAPKEMPEPITAVEPPDPVTGQDEHSLPIAADAQTLEPIGAKQGEPQASNVEGKAPETPVTEVPSIETDATGSTEAEAPKTTEEVDDSELPFPGAGIAGEGDLDINGHKIKPAPDPQVDADLPDKPVVQFGNVTPDLGGAKAAEPLKTAEKAIPKDDESTRPQRGAEKVGTKPEAPRDPQAKTPPRGGFEPRQSGQQQGSYGGSGGGYGAAGRGFNPQNLTVDFGISQMVQGLRGATGKFMQSIKPAGVNVFQATEALNKSIGQVSELRGSIVSGTDASGQALSEADQIAKWTALNGELNEMAGQMKTLKKVPNGAMDDDTLKSMKNATKELTAVVDLAGTQAGTTGALGELAKEAKKISEQLIEGLMKIIRAIMSVFSRSKSPSMD